MATGATAALSSIFAGGVVHSILSASICRRSFLAPVNLACTLASTHSRLRNFHKHHSFNVIKGNLSCESAVSVDVCSTSSVPSSSNRFLHSNFFKLFEKLRDIRWFSVIESTSEPIAESLIIPREAVPEASHLTEEGCSSAKRELIMKFLVSALEDDQNGPPRVEHLVVSEGGPVLDYITKALDLPPLFVADLIHFGAVFYALVCPEPPPTATPEQVKAFKKFTDPSLLRKRSSIKGKTFREAQKTFRVTCTNEYVEAGTYLRVHVHPKRFPRCYEIDWRSRIIAVMEDYVVLDKPAGTSVGGTTDNIEESCATFATRALGLETPLRTTHQIDNCSEGCVVLARTKEYCSVFHGKIREKKVKKLYLALAAAPVTIGVISHYMRPINIAPRLVSEDFIDGWRLCQLEVLECRKVPWPNKTTAEKNSIEDCGWPNKDFAYECKINLLTGRTHQIRAQLAACGAPLVGDSAYMPAAIAEASHPGLNPFGKNKKEYASDEALATEEWIARHGKEPSVAIGLQACQISWDDGEHTYEAGSPWWR